MKKLATLKGVKTLYKNEQKAILGGDSHARKCGPIRIKGFPYVIILPCPLLETCINGECQAL